MSGRFYVTTPIYYVNAVPHLGTFYSTVVADAFARYQRARHGAESTMFLTGLDEHGQKIERMAKERGLEPQAYCDDIAQKFQETWRRAGRATTRAPTPPRSPARRPRWSSCGSAWRRTATSTPPTTRASTASAAR